MHLIIPNAPVYPSPRSSADHMVNTRHSANERAPSSDLPSRNAPKPPVVPSANIQFADHTGRFYRIKINLSSVWFK